MKSIKLTLTDDSPDHRAIHSVPAPLLGDPVVRCPGHAARITTASGTVGIPVCGGPA